MSSAGAARGTTSWFLGAYIAAIVAATCGALALIIAWRGVAIPPGQMTTFIVFAGLFAAGELRSIEWLRVPGSGGRELTATWAFAFGLLSLGAPAATLVTVAGITALVDVLNRRPLPRLLFNTCQLPLSLALAYLVRVASGTDGYLISGRPLNALWLASVVVAAAVLFFSNGAMAYVAIALHQRTNVRRMLRENLGTNLTVDGALLALSPCFVVVAQRSLMLLPMFLVTATLVYRSGRAAHLNEHAATHDVLTDLLNRRAFHDKLEAALDGAAATGTTGTVMLIDLDGFKQINDRLGHHAGDVVLQEVARRLTAIERPGMQVARLGGDEFALFLPGDGTAGEAFVRAREIHRAITGAAPATEHPVQVGASIGVALWPDHGEDLSTLLHCADLAMYEAKRQRLGIKIAGSGRVPHETADGAGDLPWAVRQDLVALSDELKEAS